MMASSDIVAGVVGVDFGVHATPRKQQEAEV